MVAYSVENSVILKFSNYKIIFYKNSIIDLQVANDYWAKKPLPNPLNVNIKFRETWTSQLITRVKFQNVLTIEL